MNYYYVFALRVADRLIGRGFKCFGTRPDIKNPNYNIFLFENCQEVRDAVWEICQEK